MRVPVRVPSRCAAACAALAVLCTLLVAGPASARPALRFLVPGDHGLVDLGDRITYELRGPCAGVAVRVQVTVPAGVVSGAPQRGCAGTVAVPGPASLRARGWVDGQPASVALVAGGTALPLRLKRVEPVHATVVAGAPRVVPADTDPFGGLTALAMSTGDVVDLGPIDLDRIESVNVRNLAGQAGGTWELRVGTPTGRAIARGLLGPAGSLASAGGNGWYHSVAQLAWRAGSPAVGDHNVLLNLTPPVGDAPRVYLAMVAGGGAVNWVDLNGSGAADLFAFRGERPGDFEVLFDGTSFDGWLHVGPGGFELREGAMRAVHAPHDVGWAWLWYSRAQFSDYVLRLRFRVETWDDNGGIIMRHRDPRDDPNKVVAEADEMQIQEGFENHTGGIAHEADPARLATNLVGEWNQLEVVAVDDLFVIRINGREVTRYRTAKALRSGFLAVENEQIVPGTGGHLWYDDIRVHRCRGAADRLCAVQPLA